MKRLEKGDKEVNTSRHAGMAKSSQHARIVNNSHHADILYIHPYTGMIFDHILPMGLPGLVNSLDIPVHGIYWHELNRDIISRSRIFMIDLHWYYSLDSFLKIARVLKRIAPDKPIVTGGYTASVYADILVKKYDIDYVISGDAEKPFRQLVDALLHGGDASSIPNVHSRKNSVPELYTLCTEDFNAQNYRTIDFFPTAWQQIRRLHHNTRKYNLIPYTIFPWIPVFKGCINDCRQCCGSLKNHRVITGRNQVTRDPEYIIADIKYFENSSDIHSVSIATDFITQLPAQYARKILSHRYNISVSYDFFDHPDLQLFEMLLDSFNGGAIDINISGAHGTSGEIAPDSYWKEVFGIINRKDNFYLRLQVNTDFMKLNPGTLIRKFHYLKGKVYLSPSFFWWKSVPMPLKSSSDREKSFKKFLLKSQDENRYLKMVRNHMFFIENFHCFSFMFRRFHDLFTLYCVFKKWLFAKL